MTHVLKASPQGILGISSGSPSYLFVISEREKVASLGRGGDIFVITGVAAIPLSSYEKANETIEKTREKISTQNVTTATYDSDPEDTEENLSSDRSAEKVKENRDSSDSVDQRSAGPESVSRSESPFQSSRGDYKRYAQSWFFRKGSLREKEIDDRHQAQVGIQKPSIDKTLAGSPSSQTTTGSSSESKDTGSSLDREQPQEPKKVASAVSGIVSDLSPKFIETAKTLFNSRNFFFSYDYDITRRLGTQRNVEAEKAFFDVVDQEYFWNRHLIQPLIDTGADDYVLPLMQGFIGQRGFQLPPEPDERPSEAPPNQDPDFRLTIISRRSVRRPGLRYLRRGVDDTGSVANSVETEQIMSSHNTATGEKVASFVQYRGSIPLFFSQSPYSLKPAPILHQSDTENKAALETHFRILGEKYGPVQVALLVNKYGVEAPIGQKYEKLVSQLYQGEKQTGSPEVGFEWFDFHKECRGMKFENVSILMKKLAPKVEEIGYFVLSHGQERHQNGIIRTNCMDCLDRTNVVQAAFGATALEAQLGEQGSRINLETSLDTQWFNSLWADNGDAISRQYASTAALKGDYTRTRKRNYRGALNDLGLSLTRYYNNIFGDFFTQAALDFILGNVDSSVFVDFEANMMSKDPAISMSKVRGSAVDTSSKIVIADQSENILASWALLSPKEPNMVRSLPMEEVILLLTDAALYIVRFDWNVEKVSSFERIDLRNIKGLIRGTYITAPFTAAQMDESTNVGIVIRYKKDIKYAQRTMSRTLSTSLSRQEEGTRAPETTSPTSWVPNLGVSRLLGRNSSSLSLVAVKAMPPSESFARIRHQEQTNTSGFDQIESIRSTIVHTVCKGQEEQAREFVEEHPIISVSEAKKSTGYIDYWGHSLKRLVWA